MSQIKELKAKPENTFNFIDLVERFSEEKDTKYIKLLDRLIKERLKNSVDKMANDMFGENAIENAFIAMLFSNIILPKEMVMLNYFCVKHNNGAFKGADLQKLKISDVLNQATEYRRKELEAERENLIEKLHEDDEWLVLLPLTYEASLKYGSSTKWCTAMREDRSHFDNYTKKGQLIYCINKKQPNLKYGFFNDLKHESNAYNPTSPFSLWDVQDNYVELLHSDLPIEIMKILGNYTKNNKVSNNRLYKDKFQELDTMRKDGILAGRDNEIIKLTKEGHSLAAVKLIKELGGYGLKEAKEIYDTVYRDNYYPKNTH